MHTPTVYGFNLTLIKNKAVKIEMYYFYCVSSVKTAQTIHKNNVKLWKLL